jgi:hypothetical protein
VSVNTGAWQRLITPEHLSGLLQANTTKKLSDYTPEDLPACYSMIVVPAYDSANGEKAEAKVYFWAKDPASGTWSIRSDCPDDPTRLPKDACAV